MDNREIAELIVKKINGTKNNYDAIDETIKVLDKLNDAQNETEQLRDLFKSFSPTKINLYETCTYSS